MVVPDGMPLLWALRLLGRPDAHRVRGPDLMLDVCRLAAARGIPVGLYGGRPECSAPLEAFLRRSFPGIRIACHINPPFRPLTEAELRRDAESINESGAQVLFVGIGCPKQERWMSVQRGVIAAPMIGVGAAFDFYGGRTRPAPAWMQRSGLEWLFRLASEPRRLWKRYLKHNPRYVLLAARQILARKRDRD
jgi:N-acetylglucosaminyldiphosphoundecaprenol N-acetyl-beta-D-mannosaminyltransferase